VLVIGNQDRATRMVDVMFGNTLLCRSRQPLFDAARCLRDSGYPDETLVRIRWRGSDVVSLEGSVGWAADRTVVESDRDGLRIRRFRKMEGPITD
jgi:hypothetical protein